jgi:hypothetical protein
MSQGLKIEALGICSREFSACCAMVMSRMSFSYGVVVIGASEAPMPSGRREAEASFPTWCHEELLSGVLNHGPPRGRCPTTSWGHERGAFIAPPRGEAQAAEVVSDELEVPKANGFAKGESTALQTLTVGGDDDCRWWNHQNDLEEKHAANPASWNANCQCFFASVRYRVVKIMCSYFEVVFRSMKNYKAHYSISWFRPLLRGNSPTSHIFVIEEDK